MMPLRLMAATDDAYRMPLTIGHLLDGGEMSDQDGEIVYRDGFRMTYRDLRVRIRRLASALAQFGVGHGTVVAVLDWDSHRYLECFFAVPMMGAVLQMANIRLAPVQLQYTLGDAGAEVLLVHRDFLPLVEGMLLVLPLVREVVVLADDRAAALPSFASGEYEKLLAAADPAFDFGDFDENAVATTFYTSGTTGRPKCVAFSHRQLVLHTLAVATAVSTGPGLRRSDVYMPLTPMFHVHAWGFPYVATMLGLKQVYPGRFDAAAVISLSQREGVTFSHCVPTVLSMLVDSAQQSDTSLTGLRLLIGGSALTGDLQAAACAMGIEAVNAFGMSETGPVVALGETGLRAERTGSAIPLTRLHVVDDEMEQVPADDISLGELVIRAPWLTASYPGDVEASARLWRGGWLHTQDIATIDGHGSIVIRDRLKDVIKTGGEWICSLTLEGLIASHPAVAEVAVIGVPDPKWQERPVAAIVAQPGAAPDTQEINGWLMPSVEDGTLSRYARLDAVVVLDALPRTSVGKIDKRTLRELMPELLGEQASAVRVGRRDDPASEA